MYQAACSWVEIRNTIAVGDGEIVGSLVCHGELVGFLPTAADQQLKIRYTSVTISDSG